MRQKTKQLSVYLQETTFLKNKTNGVCHTDLQITQNLRRVCLLVHFDEESWPTVLEVCQVVQNFRNSLVGCEWRYISSS